MEWPVLARCRLLARPPAPSPSFLCGAMADQLGFEVRAHGWATSERTTAKLS